MKPGYLQRLNRWLTRPESAVRQLFDQAREHGALAERIQRCLTDDMRRYCRFTHLSGDAVLFDCASAAWATQLRYSTPQLTKKLSQELGIPITKIKMQVRPFPTARAEPRAPKRLSPTGKTSLEACANSIRDPELKEALLKLAARGKGGTGEK
jgi:hypothetical protein